MDGCIPSIVWSIKVSLKMCHLNGNLHKKKSAKQTSGESIPNKGHSWYTVLKGPFS